MKCRHCKTSLKHLFIDLGFSPPSNAYLYKKDLIRPEISYPLRIFFCDVCWLVQTEDYAQADMYFSADYAYFSSTSTSILDHAKNYVYMILNKLSLNKNSYVVEIASNDGYLLRNFIELGIPCLGIEPTDSTAEAAEKLGIPVIRKFFGTNLAKQLEKNGKKADLIIGNNVYAHVPDINDFTMGLKRLLNPLGTITLEFAYLLCLIKYNQFDTIYHEHYSYLSLNSVKYIFESHGLKIYNVEELPVSIHGGSLRVYGCHAENNKKVLNSVKTILEKEEKYGLTELNTYRSFQEKADRIKNDFVAFLIEKKKLGNTVAAYGAAAKGNTLLNYGGIKKDLLKFVCDASPSKQGKFLPGSHIPILSPSEIREQKPDYIVILPWNLTDEITNQLNFVKDWGCKFVKPIPELQIL